MTLKEIILLAAVLIGMVAGYSAGKVEEQGKIELPDEAEQISHSFRHPDTLVGYRKNGVLHIEIKSRK